MIPRIDMPLWLGVGVEALGITASMIMLLQVAPSNNYPSNLLLLLASFLLLWYFPHSLSHFIVGRAVGIKFSSYYLAASSMSRLDNPLLNRIGWMMPMLGVRIDRSSLRRVSPRRRSAMYAAGVITSLLAPLLTIYTSFSIGAPILALLLIVIWVSNAIFTLYFSSKVGDISRAVKTKMEPER